MKTALMILNFGEPEQPTLQQVVPFLERIFALGNESLEGGLSAEQKQARARELAERRAPGLIAEYELIGGSPLNAQARSEAASLERELKQRGHDLQSYVGMQFTGPTVEDAVAQAQADGVELLVALPIYPLCGPSTTIGALEQLERAIRALDWNVPVREITGWHAHPAYIQLRADAIRAAARSHDVDLASPRTRLVFSAHGTPSRYLAKGSRYVEYVEHVCVAVAGALDVRDHALGYQNHANRAVQWTQPEIAKVIEEIDADTVVVDACSFMHEQSETLAELDHELKGEAEGRGLKFVRVPIPYDDPRFITLLADLAEALLLDRPAEAGLRPCRCRTSERTFCLNAR